MALLDLQQAFGYTQESLKFLMTPMAHTGQEAVGSMGNDTPVSVLSNKPKLLHTYFKQNFAQVTNPPINSIREELVMSLVSFIGPRPNLLDLEGTAKIKRLEVYQPILTNEDLERIRQIGLVKDNQFSSITIDITYPAEKGAAGMSAALDVVCAEAEEAVRSKEYNIIILSDRATGPDRIPIPSLLATSAVHHHLIKQGLRTSVGLVVETGEAHEVHQFCAAGRLRRRGDQPLSGLRYAGAAAARARREAHPEGGAEALHQGDRQGHAEGHGQDGHLDLSVLLRRADLRRRRAALELREASTSPARTRRWKASACARSRARRPSVTARPSATCRCWRTRSMWAASTPTASAARRTCGGRRGRRPAARGARQPARQVSRLRAADQRPVRAADDAARPVPAEERRRRWAASRCRSRRSSRPPRSCKRFSTGAMSFGSISREAHTTLAIAMNRIGGKSNTGEGGEEADRFKPLPNGDSMRSAIKQVASGRFGVTAEYLVNSQHDADQDGAGRQARRGRPAARPQGRCHHRQGAPFDAGRRPHLAAAAPRHLFDRGPGAADLRSEERQSAGRRLGEARLRGRRRHGGGGRRQGARRSRDHLRLRGRHRCLAADLASSTPARPGRSASPRRTRRWSATGCAAASPCRSTAASARGRDVVIGALLGADEFGFSTAPLIALGCIMMRKCHLNTCPVGVATQDPVLRAKFKGQPEHAINYFFFVAEEVREIMAALGYRTFNEMIGQSQCLDKRARDRPLEGARARLREAVPQAGGAGGRRHLPLRAAGPRPRQGARQQADRACHAGARGARERVKHELAISNRDRTAGAMLSGEVARRYGHAGLAGGHHLAVASRARPGRASAPGWRTASRSISSARPTTTSARACPAAS